MIDYQKSSREISCALRHGPKGCGLVPDDLLKSLNSSDKGEDLSLAVALKFLLA